MSARNSILFSIGFLVMCAALPFFYKYHPDVSFFAHSWGNDDGSFGYFLRDAAYITLSLTVLAIASCNNEFVRHSLALIFLINIVWEFVKLLIWNNQYDPVSATIGTLFMLGAVIYLIHLWYDHEAS